MSGKEPVEAGGTDTEPGTDIDAVLKILREKAALADRDPDYAAALARTAQAALDDDLLDVLPDGPEDFSAYEEAERRRADAGDSEYSGPSPLREGAVPSGKDRADTDFAEPLPRCSADLRVDDAADLFAIPNHRVRADAPRIEDLGPVHRWTESSPAAGTVPARRTVARPTGSRAVSRAANTVVEASQSLVVPGADLRTMSDDDRWETRVAIARWRERLGTCPAGAFSGEEAALVLTAVATLATKSIVNRDEHTALRLIRAASPQLLFLGRRHPAVFEARRAWAEALSELGRYRRAETMLRHLSDDEQRLFGTHEPRTALLLNWALVGQGRLRQAEDGFRSLETGTIRLRDPDTSMLRHLQCRRCWLLGRQGRVEDAVRAYDGVIVHRAHELDDHHHPDVADARHSQGKLLVCTGKGAEAIDLLRALAEDRARGQGDDHPDTLETLKYLHLAKDQSEWRDRHVVDRVIRDLEELLRIQDERHGPSYPMSRDTAAWLARLRHHREAIRFGEPLSDLLRSSKARARTTTVPRLRSTQRPTRLVTK
ncbi:hypothetical protein ACFZBU_43040 [Embleya sp. NPDC008237]|uniref:hypothetical protein n=1 Tax=Embleya sp. NPDC008237 TaxID=3363978 RepID=UPI0036F06320